MSDDRHDLTSRADIERLVDGFYARVREDEQLGPIFDDIARVNWSVHLPRMYDFWMAVLFGQAAFKGNPPEVHRALAARVPLTRALFDRWVGLFIATVDEHFEGPMADSAKVRAIRIARTLEAYASRQDGIGMPILSATSGPSRAQ